MSFSLQGTDGFEVEPTDSTSAWQDKGIGSEATWITLDVENLFTCDAPRTTSARIFYDDIGLFSES